MVTKHDQLNAYDWVEIYSALESKLNTMGNDDRPEVRAAEWHQRWCAHLETIMGKIGPDGRNMWEGE